MNSTIDRYTHPKRRRGNHAHTNPKRQRGLQIFPPSRISSIRTLLALLLVVAPGGALLAAEPTPASLTVADRPNDQGQALVATWARPSDDFDGEYEIFLRDLGQVDSEGGDAEAAAEFESLIRQPADSTEYVIEELDPRHAYLVRLTVYDSQGAKLQSVTTAKPVRPRGNWFNMTRLWLAILLAAVCGAVIGYIVAARRGIPLWVRPIAGLQAVTDAVGRAVEMGRKVLFVPGIQDINDIQTVAGVTVLSRVSRIAADYDAEIMIPTARSLVMVTCRETVAASYLQAGRPESYNADDIFYLTDEQFGFVAGTTGAMVREKPAACIYMGAFYAESLILAETGNSIGAIQVAGTAQPSQLPFFIAACDYTLIGEEFFAASAYLSEEPQQLGSLKGQDFGKLAGTLLIIIGCLAAPLGYLAGESVVTRDAAVLEMELPAKPQDLTPARDLPPNVQFVRFVKENLLGGEDFWPEFWTRPEGRP